jgi:hypothetical protein
VQCALTRLPVAGSDGVGDEMDPCLSPPPRRRWFRPSGLDADGHVAHPQHGPGGAVFGPLERAGEP